MRTRSQHSRHDRSLEENLRFLPAPRELPLSPLHWWRTQRPNEFSTRDVKAVRAALLGMRIPGEPDWFRAVTGDPATAIGIAIRQLHSHGMTSAIVDAAISAVVCCAIEGNSAARSVVESALRRRRRFDPLCADIILSWRTASF